jgi:hypothetical protein
VVRILRELQRGVSARGLPPLAALWDEAAHDLEQSNRVRHVIDNETGERLGIVRMGAISHFQSQQQHPDLVPSVSEEDRASVTR